MEQEGAPSLLEQLEKGMEGEEGKEEEERQEIGKEGTPSLSASPVTREEEETAVEEGAGLSELEEELQREEEIKLLHEQDSLLEQVCHFIPHTMNHRSNKGLLNQIQYILYININAISSGVY